MEEEGLSVEERSPTVILDFVWSPNAEISTIDQLHARVLPFIT